MVKRHQQAGRQLLTLLNSKQFDEGLDQVRGKVFLLAKFSQNKDGRVEAWFSRGFFILLLVRDRLEYLLETDFEKLFWNL